MKKNLKINFSKTGNFPEIDYYFKSVVRRAVKATLEHEKFPYDALVSVTFCDADYIRNLNKTYRNKDSATDVLSYLRRRKFRHSGMHKRSFARRRRDIDTESARAG